jgi:hypothetical protein
MENTIVLVKDVINKYQEIFYQYKKMSHDLEEKLEAKFHNEYLLKGGCNQCFGLGYKYNYFKDHISTFDSPTCDLCTEEERKLFGRSIKVDHTQINKYISPVVNPIFNQQIKYDKILRYVRDLEKVIIGDQVIVTSGRKYKNKLFVVSNIKKNKGTINYILYSKDINEHINVKNSKIDIVFCEHKEKRLNNFIKEHINV